MSLGAERNFPNNRCGTHNRAYLRPLTRGNEPQAPATKEVSTEAMTVENSLGLMVAFDTSTMSARRVSLEMVSEVTNNDKIF